jgi:hypothetical protein
MNVDCSRSAITTTWPLLSTSGRRPPPTRRHRTNPPAAVGSRSSFKQLQYVDRDDGDAGSAPVDIL